jgi:multidrug efflux pump subunit AcrA (membrane-fusion protein)
MNNSNTLKTAPEGQPAGLADLKRPTLGREAVASVAIVGVFLAGLLGWAAVAPLESAAIAQGVVSIDGYRKTVQHLEGGIVGEILVREGARVRAGQVLIRLDDTTPRASLELLHGRWLVASAWRPGSRPSAMGWTGSAIPRP